MRLPEWQQKILLVAASTVVALLFAEVVARLTWQPGERQRVIRYDPDIGWSLRPGSELHSIDTDRGLDYRIRINELGLRDPARTQHPSPGTQRVLMLGDSMVFGPGVEMLQRCSNQLDARLGSGIEVVNAGVGGWGTDQEYLFLCREGFDLQPDAIVLNLCVVNDVVNNSIDHEFLGTAPKPRFVLRQGRLQQVSMPPRPAPSGRERARSFLKHSRLFHYVGRHVRILQARLQAQPTEQDDDTIPYYAENLESDMSHWNVFHLPYSDSFEDAFQVTEALIAAMHDSCAARGIAFAVFALPQKAEVDAQARQLELQHHGYHEIDFDLRAPYDRLQNTCEGLGIPFLYPIERFIEANMQHHLYFERDPHPNAAGHQLAAACLEGFVRDLVQRQGATHAAR